MIKAHIYSDLHFEFMSKAQLNAFFMDLGNYIQKNPADLAILAGDICQIGEREDLYVECLKKLCKKYQQVIMTLGNHECYGSSIRTALDFTWGLQKLPSFKNLKILNNDHFVYNGQRFVGGTMWYPDKGDHFAKKQLNDFSRINDIEKEVYEEHNHFVEYTVPYFKKDDIVITHNMPFNECIAPKFAGSVVNQFFAYDLRPHLIPGNLPKMFIHGHTHSPINITVNVGTETTWVYGNPKGYPFEKENKHFWKLIAVDLP